ncbi:endonuclease/exonuclease/phosphatase family protein [Caulobacter segnis]|nr:endonuclease/exonuclease/phosphatase family protein [Caulobacter segnis]
MLVRNLLSLLGLLARGTALVLSLISAGAVTLCLGGLVSPRLDALSHVIPVWMCSSIVAFILGVLFSRDFERGAIVALSVFAFLICSAIIAPECVMALRFSPGVVNRDDLKIIQFNVWGSNYKPEETVDWIIAERADVVVIEEAGSERGPILQKLRAAFPSASCEKGRHCETVIFSRYPMIAVGGNQAEGSRAPTAWARLVGPGGVFTVVGVHYSWPLPVEPQKGQMAQLVKTVAQLDQRNTIVTGDFNSTPWSFALRRQDKAFGLYRWTRALPSWPAGQFTRVLSAPAPLLPIDHVYAGSGWRAVQVRRGPVLGSDHRPVVVTLRRLKR